ncbi:MAG: hypothetical protein OXG72_10610, partial [Acidobacteria bacterium]|nr:hypothetical protein [Acidobacteriota bacterium]
HMMYVVPHGDRLADYSLPTDPTASPAPMTALGFLKRVGAYLMGFGVLGVLGHFLRYGPERLDEDEHDDAGHGAVPGHGGAPGHGAVPGSGAIPVPDAPAGPGAAPPVA